MARDSKSDVDGPILVRCTWGPARTVPERIVFEHVLRVAPEAISAEVARAHLILAQPDGCVVLMPPRGPRGGVGKGLWFGIKDSLTHIRDRTRKGHTWHIVVGGEQP